MNWLLLRGLARESRHWFGFEKQLESLGGRSLCIDLPGFGAESHAEAPYSIGRMTDYLRARFQEKRGSTAGDWGVLGISLGGMVTLDWLKRYPNDFRCGVVLNTSARDLSPTFQRFSLFAGYCMAQAAFAKTTRERERHILRMVSNLRADDEGLLTQLVQIAGEKPYSKMAFSRQLVAASQFESPSGLEVPVLILASNKDRMVDVRCSKALSERLSAPIKFHPQAGHDLTLDDPTWVCERVQEFITSLSLPQKDFAAPNATV